MQDQELKNRIWQNPELFTSEDVLQEYKTLISSNPDLWLKFSVNGIILDFKPSRYLNFLLTPENFVGKHISLGLPEHLVTISEEAIAYLFDRENHVFWKEYTYFSEGNEERFAEVRYILLADGHIFSTHTDITERKRLESAFLESESRFISMAQNAADSILIINDRGLIQFFNKAAETSFGYNQEEALNKNVNIIIPPGLKEKHDEILANYLKTQKKSIIGGTREVIAQRKNGQLFPCELSVGEFRTKTGLMFTGIIRDITQRKIHEGEIFQYRNHLEDIVEKQIGDIKKAKYIAEEASEMKSLFLANISHELKTPIHAILSYAELGEAKAEVVNPIKLKEYFHIIDSSGKRLLVLLENLLDMARLESGKMKYIFEKNCLREASVFVTNEMKAILEKHRIHLDIEKSESRWEAEFDFERIQQVIRNIISNALKFIPDQTEIRISKIEKDFLPRNASSPVNGIGIQIRDFGPGIPPEDMEMIFEKFVQSKQIKPGTKGTGLGLSISREILTDHHGLLYAENHIEGGAIFTLILPRLTGVIS